MILLAAPVLITAQVVGSRHDLATPETNDTCVFCHTPHGASTTFIAPLWNRGTTTGFIPYSSVTMNTVPPALPYVASLACLSCHDGVLAPLGDGYNDNKHGLLNAPGPGGSPDLTSSPNCERCHPDFYGKPAPRWLGKNLGDDHPISMTYPTPAEDAAFNTPPDPIRGWGAANFDDVKLYNGRIECGSCHNVHKPTYPPFLRKPNAGSMLCLTCHAK